MGQLGPVIEWWWMRTTTRPGSRGQLAVGHFAYDSRRVGRYDLGMVVLRSRTAAECSQNFVRQRVGIPEGGGTTNLGAG